MHSNHKRTVKEFNEGLYRKPISNNLSISSSKNPQLFTFNKMASTMLDYTKSPLATLGQENIDTSNTKEGCLGDNYKGF